MFGGGTCSSIEYSPTCSQAHFLIRYSIRHLEQVCWFVTVLHRPPLPLPSSRKIRDFDKLCELMREGLNHARITPTLSAKTQAWTVFCAKIFFTPNTARVALGMDPLRCLLMNVKPEVSAYKIFAKCQKLQKTPLTPFMI